MTLRELICLLVGYAFGRLARAVLAKPKAAPRKEKT
jgi:hypothetical protein